MKSKKVAVSAAWIALVTSIMTIVLLISLHVLSPEFNPAWRMVSEYAYGHYGWVLSLMFFSWGLSSWALALALWQQITTKRGKIGLWFLLIAGAGEVLAAIFDITHDIEHSIAGFLGVGGFPIAAMLLSIALGRLQEWKNMRKTLLWIANLSWISVILMILSLILMTVQVLHVMGKLPTHAPTSLPSGVIGFDGWADRFLVFFPCLWVFFASWKLLHNQIIIGSNKNS